MVVKLNVAALKQVKWHEYLTRFLLGGVITVAAGLAAEKYGPMVGGLFLAFPAIFPASATLLEHHEREKKQRAGIAFTYRGRLAAALDARGACMGALGAMLFAGVAWRYLPRSSPGIVLLVALSGWLTLSSLLWYVRKHHPWARPDTNYRS